MYPDLNIDNLLNLTIMHEKCNRIRSNAIADSPLLLHNALVYAQKKIERLVIDGQIADFRDIKVYNNNLNIENQKIEAILNWLNEAPFKLSRFKRWSIILEDESFKKRYDESFEDYYPLGPADIIEEMQLLSILPKKPFLKKIKIEDLLINCPKTFNINDFSKTFDLNNISFVETSKINLLKEELLKHCEIKRLTSLK